MSNGPKFSVVALVALVSATLSAGAVLALGPQTPVLRAARAETQLRLTTTEAAALSTGASIRKGQDGHFWASGEVNGASVRFLVDTGATAVALTPADAERLGFKPETLTYSYKVVTAGGSTRAASVKIASLTVAGARVENVDALVIEKGLDTSLLGMSFLGRLTRFEGTRQALILHS